jgi:hypothetical protein
MKLKNFLMKNHHALILVTVFILLTVLAFFINSENFGFDINKEDSSKKTSSPEKSTQNDEPTKEKSRGKVDTKTNSEIKENFEEVDYSNFIPLLLENEMISEIPKNGVVSLNTFNFNTGVREVEKTFILKKDSVYESNEPADIYVNFHSKYINQINSNNLCEILVKANENGDFGAWSELETTALMWKYKSMLKYRDCLGL